MMASDKAGVVIPLFNKEATIGRAVASVLSQSYADLSLVVVDDGSTDAGPDWVEQSADPRVRLIRTPNNGPGAARNVGMRALGTTWVGLLDADDEWSEGFLERTMTKAVHTPPGVCAVFTQYSVPDLSLRTGNVAEGVVEDYYAALLDHGIAMMSSSVLLRRDHILSLGGFVEGRRYAENAEIWFRLACSGKFYFIPEDLSVRHLDAPNRCSPAADFSERIQGIEAVLNTYEHYRQAQLIPPEIKESAAHFMDTLKVYLALQMISSGKRWDGMYKLLTEVRPGRYTWRQYLRCLTQALVPHS
ncbi:MAG: glycosyltransferase family 2 protein [Chloroflexi bacterium]|nr:MAG: glycosyltransferase family 2 protein [Chloroflexota bacterium]